jgi:ribosome-associated protein
LEPEQVRIETETIKVQQLLKWVGAAATGGEAKEMIARGEVAVNGEPELKRGRQLHPGDLVQLADGRSFILVGRGEE